MGVTLYILSDIVFYIVYLFSYFKSKLRFHIAKQNTPNKDSRTQRTSRGLPGRRGVGELRENGGGVRCANWQLRNRLRDVKDGAENTVHGTNNWVASGNIIRKIMSSLGDLCRAHH